MSKVIVSLHWGYSIGGVGKYASIIDKVNDEPNIELRSVVILARGAHVDTGTMNNLRHVETLQLKSKLDISWLWKLRRLLKHNNPDLVMTHGFNGHFLMLIEKYVLGINVSLVCSYHGEYHATTTIKKYIGVVYNRLTEFYIRHCAVSVVAVANYCREFLISRGIDSSKVIVIHNGIDNIIPEESQRLTLRQGWGVSDNEILLGVASRIDPVKGLIYLMNAFVSIHARHPDIKLVVIGTGTCENMLQSIVKKHGIESQVIFTGFRSDIDDCLSAMDIFILPSLAEYHSIALLEAMRAGKTIISTDVGGNTESVRDMREAVIIPPADSDAIARAVDTLLDDKAERECLRENARNRFLELFTEAVTVRKTADWLQQQLDKS